MTDFFDYKNKGILRGFISSRKASKLANEFIDFCNTRKLIGDTQVVTSQCAYNYLPFVELLCKKTKEVGNIIGTPVIPTYAYARVYKNGSVLERHKDRDACEISITLNLKKDTDWPIFIDTGEKEVGVELNPGDGMIYEGCKHDHWRNKFEGEEYVQVFLHYVQARGKRKWAFFDKFKSETEMYRALDEHSACGNTAQQLAMTIPTPIDVRTDSGNETNIVSINGAKGDRKISDFIYVIEDVFSEEECDFILNEYVTADGEWKAAFVGANVDGKGTLDRSARNVDEIYMSSPEVRDMNPSVRTRIDEIIYSKVSHLIKMYVEKFPLANIAQDSGYNLLRYRVGQFYVQHVDDFTHIPRLITCSIQLNDNFEGGEFAFFDRDVVIKQKRGTAVLFPSNFIYPHEVLPVTKGVRYAIITWLR